MLVLLFLMTGCFGVAVDRCSRAARSSSSPCCELNSGADGSYVALIEELRMRQGDDRRVEVGVAASWLVCGFEFRMRAPDRAAEEA